eukprot:823809_1
MNTKMWSTILLLFVLSINGSILQDYDRLSDDIKAMIIQSVINKDSNTFTEIIDDLGFESAKSDLLYDVIDSIALNELGVSSTGVIQIQRTVSHTQVTLSAAGWQEPSIDYRVSITPKYIDTHILISFHFGWNGYGISEYTLVSWAVGKSIAGASMSREDISSSGQINGVRNRISGMVQRRNNGYDSNDQNFCYWTSYDYPGTKETITYSLMMTMESAGAGPIKIGASSYDTSQFGWTMPVTIIAMEIRN